jgi:hypothetical protein
MGFGQRRWWKAAIQSNLATKQVNHYIVHMSMAEIIQELPKLSAEERLMVLRRVQKLVEEDGLLFLNEATDLMFQDLDQREARDVHCKTR